ncbi:NUDIX domain-containing protein [Actinosynnema sp. NPDC050436]|uniref:NUDIX hydrolase n=1 Tax=Actinosynnema sp. NPDC050436 TaxID=3155659 RepID=UPI0033E13D97
MSDQTTRYQRIVVAALAVVPGPGGTITFVHQRNGPFAGNWLLPGGGIEVGECARDAVVREAFEEVGCLLRDPQPFAVYEIIGHWPDGRTYHLNMTAFLEHAEHRVPRDFAGHNVDGVRQDRVQDVPLHSTDYRILVDAGVMSCPEPEIARRLAADGITMTAFTGSRIGVAGEARTAPR